MSTPTRHWEFDPTALRVKVDVTLSADLNRISEVVESVLAMLKAMDCGCGKEFHIETALREALANAIVHGCGSDAGKSVRCSVACDEDRGLLIIVSDPGAGFDPNSLADPTMAENLFADHGRGIFMINQLMEGVRHERGGTEIHMHVRGGKPCAGELF